MLNLKTIAYTTTFLATSFSLNFITNTVKNSLPEIDMKTLEATSPYLEYAAVAGSWAVFGLKIYAAHYTGMGAVSAVGTAIDVAAGAYALVHNPEIINAVMPALAGVAGYMPNMAALVPSVTGVVSHGLESLTTYNLVNMVSMGVTGCGLADLSSIVNLVNFISSSETVASVVNLNNVASIIDIVSTGVIGVSASDLIGGINAATSFFSFAIDYDLL